MHNTAEKLSSELIIKQRAFIESFGINLPMLKDSSKLIPSTISSKAFASYLDATYLSPPFSIQNVQDLCEIAIQENCASVCIPPYFITTVKKTLANSSVKVCSVADFPFGSGSTGLKISSIQNLVSEGCDEVDFVINYSLLLDSKNIEETFEQFSAIRDAAPDICLKAIIETSYLNNEHIINACSLLDAARIDFAKTSTGFSQSGASLEHIKLMHACSSEHLKLKASGGISDIAFAKDLINAGASRLGTSKAKQLIAQFKEEN